MLKNIKSLYIKDGERALDKYLSCELLVTENIDAYRFTFKVDSDYNLIFFKKNTKIDLVDRTISNIYENFINYFNSLDKNIIYNLPIDYRFGFYFFPSKKPIRISYENLPMNNIILSDITKKINGKVVENFDFRLVSKYAKKLNVSGPPIIFCGKLNEEQKNILKNYIINLSKDTSDASNDIIFNEVIKNVFGSSYSNNSIIEGIVLKNENEVYQLKDPVFEKISSIYENRKHTKDFFDILMIQLKNFLIENDLNTFKEKANSTFKNHLNKYLKENNIINESIKSELKYICLISEIFNSFVQNNKNIKNIEDNYLNDFLISDFGDLNLKFIYNKNTLNLVKESKFNKELFKTFLNVFRVKISQSGLLTESFCSDFNSIVNEIKYISKYTIINENEEDSKNLKHFKLVSSLQAAFEKDKKEEISTEEKTIVNLFILNDSVLNKDHIEYFKQLKEANDYKIVLVYIKDLCPLNNELCLNILKDFKSKNEDLILDILPIDNLIIRFLFNILNNKKYIPISLCVEYGLKNKILLELKTEYEIYNLKLHKKFKIVEYKDNKKEYLNGLILYKGIQNNFDQFKELVPNSVLNFLTLISNSVTINQ